MKAEHSVYVDCSMYDYGTPEIPNELPHPRDIPPQEGTINYVQVPQSLYDSWWLLYEFATTEARDAFMAKPPAVFRKAHMYERDQAFFDKWTGT